jgi:diguanylate cyclase (GGDEF)-like protein/PAS domain S-box-containing protein
MAAKTECLKPTMSWVFTISVVFPVLTAAALRLPAGFPCTAAIVCLLALTILFAVTCFGKRVLGVHDVDEALRENELRFRNVFEEALVGMVILDMAGRVHSVNRGFCDITGFTADELTGKHVSALVAADEHAAIVDDRALLLSGKVRSYRSERKVIRADGALVWCRVSVSLLQWKGELHTIALIEDITGQKRAREELARLALHDPLTGLPNRRHFEKSLEEAILEASVNHHEVALVYVDIDDFKFVNDTMGHRAGDLLLQEVARRITGCMEFADLLCDSLLSDNDAPQSSAARVGGDEFVITLKGLDGPGVPARVAERLLLAFDAPVEIDGHEIPIGASIGISRYPFDGQDAVTLLQTADAAMYSAKRSGKHRYGFFSAQMRLDAHQRLAVESRLRRALEHREISVSFQPQYELDTNRLVRFEALCRWFNPELGNITPDRFIPIAEKTGMIIAIGSFVLRESCRQALQWQSAGPVQIAVNVSAVQFARADFVESITSVLCETGLQPSLLELELTESTLLQDRDDAIRKMNTLRQYGVQISIDDFGTGYSSLSYLQNMPVAALKIDRSFTAKLGSSQTALSMVKAIIAMARALGLRIVTEGVENQVQVEILRQLGCDDVQGFYYGKPEKAALALERVMREGNAQMALVRAADLVSAA